MGVVYVIFVIVGIMWCDVLYCVVYCLEFIVCLCVVVVVGGLGV